MFCDVQIYFKSANKRRIAVNKITTVETAFCVILGHHKKSGKNRPLFDWRTSLPRPGVDFNKWAKR